MSIFAFTLWPRIKVVIERLWQFGAYSNWHVTSVMFLFMKAHFRKYPLLNAEL